MINKNNNLNLLLTKMAYGYRDDFTKSDRWMAGGHIAGFPKDKAIQATKLLGDIAAKHQLGVSFTPDKYFNNTIYDTAQAVKAIESDSYDLPNFYVVDSLNPKKKIEWDKVDKDLNKVINKLMKGYTWGSAEGAFIPKQSEAKRESSKEKSLHDWFSRKGETGSKGGWVDCNAPDGSGGYKTCGRSSGEERGEYPACRPTPGACKEKGRGDSWGKRSEEDKKKDDACTRKVKARYDVWPSAYASGALTKCRQVGADNWGNKTKESSIKVANNLTRLIATKRAESAAWQRSEGKNPEGGLNRRGIKSYKEENPDSNLQMAVTTDPSKLDPDSKAAKRRKSFCARMGGMPGPMQDEKGRPTRKALSLSKWNC